MEPRILSARFGRADGHKLAVYEREGGYAALRQVLGTMTPGDVVELVKESGLRGRGGAGFPTGMKWGFVPQGAAQVYFMINADESEPGTFKDRYLMDYDPHLMLEGTIIGAFAVRSNLAVIYIRGEYGWLIDRTQVAVDEAYAAGYLGQNILGSGYNLEVIVHKGAGAYICGEETGLINSVTGTKGQPSIKPPFPAVSGFLGKPTIVNNVETVAAVPWIITHGAAAYKAIGTEKSSGTKLWSVSGPVKRPGVYEVPLGIPFAEFFRDQLGGMVDGEQLKAVIVGGSSVPVLTADEIMGCNLDYESLQACGTMLGSGGMIVIPASADMVELIQVLMHFYWDESCGQCTPCREGTGWLHRIVKRLRAGEAVPADLELLEKVCQGMAGLTICPLSDAAVMPMRSFLQKFRSEFAALIHETAVPGRESRWARENSMAKLTIDGREIEVPDGTRLFDACRLARDGRDLPHFCYHPDLSIAGVCRLCQVEIEGLPKLTIACNTTVREGMVVHTTTPRVQQVVKQVLEMHLINHPVDCPICDQAGECGLQDQYMEYGLYESDVEKGDKVLKAKAKVIGPHVILDKERCVLCSRCVRFCDEVTHTGELGIFNRGDRAEIGVAPGVELDNNYSLNTVDICPVGALTSRDFRFQKRVWLLRSTHGVCQGCATGCNVRIDHEGGRVYRLKPRRNDQVNGPWMCDLGRMTYKDLHAQNRLRQPARRQETLTWAQAGEALHAALKPGGVALAMTSGRQSLEELVLFRLLARRLTGESQVFGGLADEARGEGDDILLSGDRLPNREALAWLGLPEIKGADLAIERGVVLIYGGDPAADPDVARALARARVVYLGTHANTTSALAELVIPLSMWAEKDGLSVNRQGRVQRYQRAILPPGEAREDWRVLVELLGITVAGLPALRRLVAAELGLEDTDVLNNLPVEGLVPRVPALEED